MPTFSFHINKLKRLALVLSLFVAACPANFLYAQRAGESSVSAISIQTRPARSGTIFTLFADTSLIHTQTWRDIEGFHIVLPSAGQSRLRNVPRGVKVSQVGKSLEVLVRLQPGAEVRVQSLFNRLTLFIGGELDVSRKETFAYSPLLAPCQQPDGLGFRLQLSCGGDELLRLEPPANAPVAVSPASQPEPASATAVPPSVVAVPAAHPSVEALNTPGQLEASTKYFPTTNLGIAVGDVVQGDGATNASAAAVANAPGQIYPANVPTTAYDDESNLPQAKIAIEPEQKHTVLSAFLSPAGAAIFLGQGMLLLFLLRQRAPARRGSTGATGSARSSFASEADVENAVRELSERGNGQTTHAGNGGPAQSPEMSEFELTLDALYPTHGASASDAKFSGGEAIRQEVRLLVKGEPYRAETLSSRDADSRRAVEAALVEALNAPGLNDVERGRVRRALEEHGFVLRRGAQLLSATDARARAAAARALADMNSAASMPFLLEALHDAEATVRTQVMSSLGAMKVPSAIGAVLDAARRHPETPPMLLGNVLNACSFGQSGDFKTWSESALLPDFMSQPAAKNSTGQLDKGIVAAAATPELVTFTAVEDLPETLDDENFAGALSRLKDTDEGVRASAARALGQFRVWRSVKALISSAEDDESAVVRATAVTSLGSINHESVLAHLLIAFADDARDVRAAAARSLSRLSIGRTAALVRLLETADEAMVHRVARACIKTGMVSQAINKLNSPDRRQGYEAFLLLSLLEQANETEAISNAAARCQDNATRLAALRLFGLPELPPLSADSPAQSTTGPTPKPPSPPPAKSPRKPPPKPARESLSMVRAYSKSPEASPEASGERGIMPLYMPKPVR